MTNNYHGFLEDAKYFLTSPIESMSVNATDTSAASITAAQALYLKATGNVKYDSFQAVLSVSAATIQAAGGQVLAQMPTDNKMALNKGAVALYMLAMLYPPGNFRQGIIAKGKTFQDDADNIWVADSKPENVEALCQKIGSTLAWAAAQAYITPGVSNVEVERWGKYCSALFNNLFNIEIIQRKQGFEDQAKLTGSVGRQLETEISHRSDELVTAAKVGIALAILGNPLVIAGLSLAGITTVVLGAVAYRRRKRSADND